MVAIGQTHVILSTYAGARFGFSLLWVVVLAHLLMALLAVSAGLIAYPLIYIMNIYAVTKLVEPEFRPSRLSLVLAWTGVAYSIIGVILLLLVRVMGLWN
jgi:Mn2+/Fe2+ NRAMP family transporter